MSSDKKQSGKKQSSKEQSPKRKSSTKLDKLLNDYIHKKPTTFSPEWKEHCKLFMWPAGLMALIPSFLYWGAYDYRADGFIGVEYIFYLLAFGITALGLLTTYTQIYVDHCHYFKVSSRETVSKEQIAQNEIQSKWWTMFQVNGLYLLLFLFANFYAFKCSIPSLHFRYLLTTAGPAASLHLWIHGTHSILGGKDTPQK